MDQKKDFLDEITQTLMLIMILVATACTLVTFVLQFIMPGAVDLFKHISFYAYGWMVFLALGPTVRRGMFMKITLLVDKYPAGVQTGAKAACQIILFVLMAVMCFFSFQITMTALSEGAVNAAVPVIPLAAAYAAPAVGYLLGVISFVRNLLDSKKGGNN